MNLAESATNAPEWTVSELSGALKRTLEDAFGHVRLRGEISGYRGPHSSGHAYFCLKDRDARLDAVVWKTTFGRLRFKPQEGLEVIATGRITTFPGKSTYQIVIEALEPAGIGALMALLDERRRRLAAEGLFAPERKRKLPFLPGVVAVVTSPTGAVIRDILHRLADRFPRHVVVWPVRVQGETCGAEVAAAIAGLNALAPGGAVPRPDVIIVARGGGSLEDLWGFNDEAVVRAVAAGAIPLIAAIGHETDWTLIDHAADLRAPTPTGAAEMAVPVRAELLGQIGSHGRRHAEAWLRAVEARRTELRSASRALPSGEALLAPRRQKLDVLSARLAPALLANARLHEAELRALGARLAKKTPEITLAAARGKFDAVARQLGPRFAGVVAAERLRLVRCREQLAETQARAGRAMTRLLERRDAQVVAASGMLASLGYRSVLARGFAVVRDAFGRPLPRVAALAPGQAVEIEFADGRRRAQIEGRSPRRAGPLAQASLFDH